MNEYWRQREEQAQAEYALTEEQYAEQLNGIYDYMLDQVKKEINGFYSKYATAEGISINDAKKKVAETDIDEYKRKAKKYVEEKDFSAKANEEMKLYNLTMKVNRLELLKANIGLEMVSSFDELNKKLGEDLTERAIQEMARQSGILGMTTKGAAKTANSIVGASFHNATFSDRIWMYQDQLRAEIGTLLRQGMIQGYNPNELARHINKLFDTGKYNCERLMRTELTRVQSDAQLQSFIAAGFDEYQFNALGNACPICRELDEQHFRIADAEPGENLPPIHPNCRCAVSAYMDDESYNEWLDSYKDHGMSYEDWLENRPTAVEAKPETKNEPQPDKETEEEPRHPSLLDELLEEDADRDYKQMLDWYNRYRDDPNVSEREFETIYDRAEEEWREQASKQDVTEEEEDKIYSGYVATLDSYELNDVLRENPGKSLNDLYVTEDKMTLSQYETAQALDSAISKNHLEQDTILTRYLKEDAIADIFGIDEEAINALFNSGEDPNEVFAALIGDTVRENGYASTSGNANLNIFVGRRYNKLEIYAPSGTNAFMTGNFEETEIILGRNTNYAIMGFDLTDDEFVIKVRIVE